MFIVMMVGLHRGTATNEIPSLFANGVINGMGVKMLLPNSVSMLTHTHNLLSRNTNRHSGRRENDDGARVGDKFRIASSGCPRQ